MTKKIILEKMFSRQKSLMYMMMWDDSSRIGYQEFVHYDYQNCLFVYDPKTKKAAAWFDPGENQLIEKLLSEQIAHDKDFVQKIIAQLDLHWQKIFPYLCAKQTIMTVEELLIYHQSLTLWWAAMNTVYPLINNPSIDQTSGKIFLSFREQTERYTGKMDTIVMEFLASKLDDKYKDLAEYCLIDEAVQLIQGTISDNELQQIQTRKNGYFIFQAVVYPASYLAELLSAHNFELKQTVDQVITEFKGTPAFPGKMRGLVQRIITNDDIAQFVAGRVLVAETTYPDHVSAMKQAIAFVTDEGGITCHAAIVSRELKIPCIVGTKIATQVLHDGDEVEVDADHGVVRIIKKAV
jgi:phosphohistidine swiveling domain-containing protein